MYFTKEDVEAGLMTEFVSFLCRYSYQSGPRDFAQYNDIHIEPADCEEFIVEWEQAPWSHDYGGRFEYVDRDQFVCNFVEFPDKHFEYTPEDEDEAIKEWLGENPGWVTDSYGHWHYSEQEKSPNFTFHIFDPESGKSIADDIQLSDEKAKEIIENCEKIKAEKPKDKMSQWLDENAGWHDSENGWTKE